MRVEQIGDCVLYLADCRAVLPTLEAESVEMVWTDPPYGHGNHDGDYNARLNEYRGLEQQPIANDTADGMRTMVDFALTEATRILKHDCCCCCCCGGGGPRPTFAWVAERMDRAGLSFFHSVIWDKRNPGLGWRYRRQHEMVMIAHRKGGKLLWSLNERAVPNIVSMMPPRERDHPNEKPLPLVEGFVEWHSLPGQMVLDMFMGGGTTGVACARLGRRFIGIELDPNHYETALRRITDAYRQPRLFAEPAPKPVQMELVA
jgi:site-specific DNA-methyltransferase (adenine-specific)